MGKWMAVAACFERRIRRHERIVQGVSTICVHLAGVFRCYTGANPSLSIWIKRRCAFGVNGRDVGLLPKENPVMRAIQPLRELVVRFDERRRAWTSNHPDAINWFNVMRLGLFQLGLGLSLAPLTGTLNRVLIAELGIPASMVGFLLAIHFFVSPVRAIMGFRSDKQRAEGRWRTPYVVLGAML